MTTATTHSVRSADGTEIGFRRIGVGRPLVLVHGGLLASQHFVPLADELASDFEVIVPDRRGRGMSGPYGSAATRVVDREAEDIRAVIDEVGAHDMFGLSSGAIVSLNAVLGQDAITRLALYEPPLSVNGSTPVAWADRYERDIAAGRTAAALITGMRGLKVDLLMSRIPHVAAPILNRMLRHEHIEPGDVAILDLVPTWHYDITIIGETADSLAAYSSIHADVLLMGGSRSPGYLTRSVDHLARELPNSRRTTLRGLGHQAAVDQPDRVASSLRAFLLGAAEPPTR